MNYAVRAVVRVMACWLLLEAVTLTSGAAVANAGDESLRDSVITMFHRLDSLCNESNKLLLKADTVSNKLLAQRSVGPSQPTDSTVPPYLWLVLLFVVGLSAILTLVIILLGGWTLWRLLAVRQSRASEMGGDEGVIPVPEHPRFVSGIADDGLVLSGVDKGLVPGLGKCFYLLRELEALLYYFAISSSRSDESVTLARSATFKAAIDELNRTYEGVLSKLPKPAPHHSEAKSQVRKQAEGEHLCEGQGEQNQKS